MLIVLFVRGLLEFNPIGVQQGTCKEGELVQNTPLQCHGLREIAGVTPKGNMLKHDGMISHMERERLNAARFISDALGHLINHDADSNEWAAAATTQDLKLDFSQFYHGHSCPRNHPSFVF
jgi:hypothetical protein